MTLRCIAIVVDLDGMIAIRLYDVVGGVEQFDRGLHLKAVKAAVKLDTSVRSVRAVVDNTHPIWHHIDHASYDLADVRPLNLEDRHGS